MAFPILGHPRPQYLSNDGGFLAGGYLYVYDPATDEPKATYPTADDADAATNPNDNPITLNSSGKPASGLWGVDGETYKYTVTDSLGTTIETGTDVGVRFSSASYTPSHTGASSRTLLGRLDEVVSVKDFGAAGDGSTDDATAIQAAIDQVSNDGGGVVRFPEGTYLVSSTLIIKSKVVLLGESRWGTTIKANNSLNDSVIETVSFDTLTGTNTWLTSGGVPYGFGIVGMSIDGNKANNSSGDGLKIYAKGYVLDDLLVYDCAGRGIYSECANATGQTDETDMPEGKWGSVWVRNCDGKGILFRGPHDQVMDSVVSALNGEEGFKNETDGSTYGGLCYVNHMHVYSNGLSGVLLGARMFANQIIAESAQQSGVDFESGVTGSRINMIECFNNNRSLAAPGTYPAVRMDGNDNVISNLKVVDENGGGGVLITGNYNHIGRMLLDGDGTSDAIGLDLDGNNCHIQGSIRSFNVAGGVALRTANSAAISNNDVKLSITDCDTAWNNVTEGARNFYRISASLNSGQTDYTGAAFEINEEHVTFIGQTDTTDSFSHNRGFSTIQSGSTSVTITHRLINTPGLNRIMISPSTSLGSATQFWASNATATTFDINIDANAGQDVSFTWDVRL